MSPRVFDTFADIVRQRLAGQRLTAALEVGAGSWTLLAIREFSSARRVALNLAFTKSSPELEACECIVGNANEMGFPSDSFDCVLSSSSLEHDKYFWKSAAEIRRVLKPGGMAVIGVPIYMSLPTDKDHTTVTYARHGLAYNADFYRFSEQAVREVIFEGYSEVTDEVIVRTAPNPYLVAAARK